MTKANSKRRGRPRKPGPRDDGGRLVRGNRRDERAAAMLAVVEARGRALGVWPAPLVRGKGESDASWNARHAARNDAIRATIPYVTLPWNGSACGRYIGGENDVDDLWDVIKEILGRHEAYKAAKSLPKLLGADTLMVAAQFDEEDSGVLVANAPTDYRTQEEWTADAIRSWEWLKGITDWSRLFEVIDDVPTRGFVSWIRGLRAAMRR